MSAVRIFVPRDAAARSMGADATAQAIARRGAAAQDRSADRPQRLARPAVARAAGRGRGRRRAASPTARCSPEDVAGLFEAGFPRGGSRTPPLAHGLTEEIPYFKHQERLTFARVGITDPRSLEDYLAHGGYRGLTAALEMEPAQIVAARDRFGAARPRRRGFPGRHQMEDSARGAGRSRNTSSAMRMKATRAPSRIGC